MKVGDVDIVTRINSSSFNLNIYGTGHSQQYFKLAGKAKLSKPDNMERFMVYGVGCDNHSNLVKTEVELKKLLTEKTNSSSWTSDIIGYKLVPLYKAEKSVKLVSFNPVKRVRKVVAKKK